MTKLFINNEYKGIIKKFYHNAQTKMLVFVLGSSQIAAVALRDDEIAMIRNGKSEIQVVTKDITVPTGYDADGYGAMLVKTQ